MLLLWNNKNGVLGWVLLTALFQYRLHLSSGPSWTVFATWSWTKPLNKHPPFMADQKFWPESMLHNLFWHDLGSVKVLPPFAETTQIMRLRHGVPDLVCLKKDSDPGLPDSVLFPIEIKRWVLLWSEDLVHDYQVQLSSGDAKGPVDPVNHVYGYMRLNGYWYGILSTYEQTWFLKQGGDQDADHDLQISPTITFNHSEPTLLQCYLWFIRQANADEQHLVILTETESNQMLKDEQHKRQRWDAGSDKGKKGSFKAFTSSM